MKRPRPWRPRAHCPYCGKRTKVIEPVCSGCNDLPPLEHELGSPDPYHEVRGAPALTPVPAP